MNRHLSKIVSLLRPVHIIAFSSAKLPHCVLEVKSILASLTGLKCKKGLAASDSVALLDNNPFSCLGESSQTGDQLNSDTSLGFRLYLPVGRVELR